MNKPLKERRCAVCRELYTPKRIGLKITKVCLNAACVLDWAQGVKAKDLKKKEREDKKINAQKKRDFYSKDLPYQLKLCQKVFNRLRVLQELKWFADRGLEPVCISCGKPKGGDNWCCGHFKTVGAQSGLRFDKLNTYLQHNRHCNMALSGDIYGTKNTMGYIAGLKYRFGDDAGQAIIDYCETNTETRKWTCDELIAMRKEWNKQIRELENASKTM